MTKNDGFHFLQFGFIFAKCERAKMISGDRMKKKFLKATLSIIKKNNPDFDDIKMDELRYGLEGVYLMVTKMVIIIPAAFLLGIGKELILMLLFYNLLRENAGGLHATKSWMCLLSSSIIFLALPLLSRYVIIPFEFKIILGIIGILFIFKYAPADTKKAPIIRKEKRDKKKFISTIIAIILVFLCVFIQNEVISNLILFGLYTEVVLILPLTYKIFHLSYNNYKTYVPTYTN